MRALGSLHRRFDLPESDHVPSITSTRIGVVRRLPEVLAKLGVELPDVLEAAGISPDIFGDPDNRITYPELVRLVLASEQRSNCDHIALLITERTGLADMGPAGQLALCSRTVGEGLRKYVALVSLDRNAAIYSVIESGGFTRVVYAISEQGLTETRHFQLGSLAIMFNVVQELCGNGWLPSAVTLAIRSPADPRPCRRFFRAPLRFDSDESALYFDSRWLAEPLPPVDPLVRQRAEAAIRARRKSMLADFPATVRRIVRKQLLDGACSMDRVAAVVGVHRRTLDRHLQHHGVRYGELAESVRKDVACQLLRDTDLQVQQIAASLQYSSAANLATAFRRWTGDTPSEYRRQAR